MKKEIREQLEGSVSVDADATLTPITRKEIRPVDATQWAEMSLTELYEQKAILESRRLQLYEIEQPAMAQQVEKGIALIDLVIKKKNDGLPRLM